MRVVATDLAVIRLTLLTGTAVAVMALSALPGCPLSPGADSEPPPYVNGTDKTNGGAAFVGSASCRQCHADIAALHDVHPHAQALTAIRGVAPNFPENAILAGVPNPPDGFSWADVAYVIGGYTRGARFIDQSGFILTTGETGTDTQWNLTFPANGTSAGFAPFAPDATMRLPVEYADFAPRTTGALPPDAAAPEFQDNRPGLRGTWLEEGAQCEACHGPGGEHFRTDNDGVVIDRTRIFVDRTGAQSCAACHSTPFDDRSGRIAARDGFIAPLAQWPELKASGGHADFSCTVCHDPHGSSSYDRDAAIRNECRVCHGSASMAGHGGEVLRRGQYVEPLSCASCHMPFAARAASTAKAEFAGPSARMGDTRSHIFRISSAAMDFNGFFSDDGSEVRRDANGQAALTVDFVCLRCHNGDGLFALTVERAAEIAERIHELPE